MFYVKDKTSKEDSSLFRLEESILGKNSRGMLKNKAKQT